MSSRAPRIGAISAAALLALALSGCAGGAASPDTGGDVQPLDPAPQTQEADAKSDGDSADAAKAGSNAILQSTGKAAEASKGAGQSKTADQATCEHDWKVETKTVAGSPKTETVEIPATWEEQTKLETVCNSCMAVVTGAEAEHAASTGHTHFTPNVPVRQMVKTSEARTETRETGEAESKEVPTGFDVCTRCGLERQSTEAELSAYSQG